MRPAVIAFVAACLPLGAYAQLAWTPPAATKVETVAAPVAAIDKTVAPTTAGNTAAPKNGAVAANTPDVPSKEPPLCASPAVSAWNPAATGDGRICTPTQWAESKRSGRG
jgi:hypothetical protein